MAKQTIDEIFEEVKNGIAGLKAVSAVEVEIGLAIGSLIVDEAFDLDAASAYNSEVLKAKIKAMNAMGMSKEKIDIIIIELTSQIHLIQPIKDGSYLLYIALDRSLTNMGMARKVALVTGKKIESILN